MARGSAYGGAMPRFAWNNCPPCASRGWRSRTPASPVHVWYLCSKEYSAPARVRLLRARRPRRGLPDPERVSLNEAARICGVSHRTIERLVEAGLLRREQVTPRAPWEIRRADLNDELVRSVIERLLRTGKLVLQGGGSGNQSTLFTENEGDDNARHHE